MTYTKATCIGMCAILLWSTLVGLVRGISESLGPVGGAATIYTAAALLMLLTTGFPNIRSYPRAYLFIGGTLFVSYEVSFALALGYAASGRQTLEVAMVNYLWPSLTVLFAVLFTGRRASWLIVPGLMLSLFGVSWVLGGDNGLDVGEMLRNMQSNPRSYVCAFVAALLWSIYCTLTIRISHGHTDVTFFLMLTALVLWVHFTTSDTPPMQMTWKVGAAVCMAAVAMGFGYAAWNVGIVRGNVTMLATASYFAPVFSAAIAATWLGIPLSVAFWQGALMVCAGSLLCWLSTRRR